MQEVYEAAYAAFLAELSDDRDELTFEQERAIRAAVYAALQAMGYETRDDE